MSARLDELERLIAAATPGPVAAEVLSNALEDSGLEGGDVDALRSALAALDGTPEGGS